LSHVIGFKLGTQYNVPLMQVLSMMHTSQKSAIMSTCYFHG